MRDDRKSADEGHSGSERTDWAKQFHQALNESTPGSSSGSPESTQSTPQDVLLGKIALDLGLLETSQLMECLKVQETGRAQGKEVPLGELLLARKLIKADDLTRLLLLQKRQAEGIPELPRYEIRERAGEGATAVVYRAWDLELKRPVAIKILREGAGLSDVARQRFRREAQATAGLLHPNVVLVLDTGEKDGRLYLVMELVDGRPLGEALKDGSKTEEQRLRLLEQAARGVGAAHRKGVVHRDLKPSNILVTLEGVPKVADFGLAHLVDSSTELTRTGSTLGTPLYMSPEQVRGQPDEITPRTDVYALGAILYEILTGRPPHTGETMMEIYGKIAREQPTAPRKLNPKVSLDLETIALKAIEKNPGRRYPDADAFAEDLRRHLNGEAIDARPLPRIVRMGRWGFKHRAVLIPAGAVVFFLMVAVAWTNVRRGIQVKAELTRAALFEKKGKNEDAQLAYRASLALDAGNPDAEAGLARTATELSRREETQREADRLLETARHDLEAVYRYLYDPSAQYAELVRRVDERQKLIEEAIAKAPGKALGHYLLGRA
ncbi:MAG TPA: protein kinase, partial [Planctomycetota bacterium]|nr:protein kinase [Planctomycetota bacterium]